ncbi:ATP-binding protein [Photobacterium sp. ZSDE20]|uniref:ATP-binding protein n=1 Tax=Photobacterium pectinilyticum TaxID=2906793 RepID=A0ABT1NDD1_9GAMM|nr:ATP-binding protein [Photobacterium sp. ZSDE20]MCQ1061344.1 ATP-binding protein [Photobacterium sp. ZSDE20]MDD1830034.1 ATP-binding protein [Photobacterium sp. ZSDE20]
MKQRTIKPYLLEVMEDTPILAVIGARQVGKSTIAKELIPSGKVHQITLDDQTTLKAAFDDPVGLIRSLKTPALVDEIQKAPHLTSAIKMVVDEKREPGSFVITGSADLRALSKTKSDTQGKGDSMAGRVEWVTLHPLTQAEIAGAECRFLDELMTGEFTEPCSSISMEELVDRVVIGGYPEVVERAPRRRGAWFKSYINSTIRSDLEEVYNIRNSEEALVLLKSLAINVSETLVKSNLYKDLSIARNTADGYIASLVSSHLVDMLPAWHKNEGKALISSPKVNFVDTGLVCNLRGVTASKLLDDRKLLGNIFESFVVTELSKLANLHDAEFERHHYREKESKAEIDLILTSEGVSVGVEIKSGMTYSGSWVKHLKKGIADGVIDHGVVIYTGDRQYQVGDGVWLIPVSKFVAFD